MLTIKSKNLIQTNQFKPTKLVAAMMIVLLAFTYCSGDKESQTAKVGKLALLQLTEAGSVSQASETKPATQKTPTNLKVRKSSDSSARSESVNQEYATTGSNLQLDGKIFSVLEFGQGESLEISYVPQYDAKGALKSVSSESIAYKDSFGTRVSAISCDVNSENELNCLFGTNARSIATDPFTLTVLKPEGGKEVSKISVEDKNLKNRRIPWQDWVRALLWWDCVVWGNQHSCSLLAIVYCPVRHEASNIPACDSSGVCYCPVYEINCRNESRVIGQNRCN
ncbi:MAG: hypothetical protein KBF93_02175 [Leptospiraceae bacterium]|nr:hypothetical protein [Leptospiraceae bacterium]